MNGNVPDDVKLTEKATDISKGVAQNDIGPSKEPR